MEKKHGGELQVAAASMVGASLILLVLLTQTGRLLWPSVLKALFIGSTGQDAVSVPEWFSGLYNLLMAVVTFLIPYIFLKITGRPLGLKLSLKKGPVPVIILLPMFLGLMVAANSVTNMLKNVFSALFKLELAPAWLLPNTFAGKLLYFITACIVASVFEELLFRGAVQGLLRSWGPALSILVTALLFTILHATVWELPTIFILSLMLGYIAEISHSVLPCIILHSANNTFAFLMVLARERMQATAAFALILWMMLLFVALFVASVWAVRSFKLGPRFKIRQDIHALGPAGKRTAKLMKVPVFTGGVLATLANFIVGLTS